MVDTENNPILRQAVVNDCLLIYSVSNHELLDVFRPELDRWLALTDGDGALRCEFRLSREQGRIDLAYLRTTLNSSQLSGGYFFVCGPKEMIMSTVAFLKELGVEESRIIYELWW
jgi:ferredoxin-NADP reductase